MNRNCLSIISAWNYKRPFVRQNHHHRSGYPHHIFQSRDILFLHVTTYSMPSVLGLIRKTLTKQKKPKGGGGGGLMDQIIEWRRMVSFSLKSWMKWNEWNSGMNGIWTWNKCPFNGRRTQRPTHLRTALSRFRRGNVSLRRQQHAALQVDEVDAAGSVCRFCHGHREPSRKSHHRRIWKFQILHLFFPLI